MNRIEKAKKYYEAIEIPSELGDVVEHAIEAGHPKQRRHRAAGKVLAMAACLLVVFTAALNTSEVFAQGVYDIPVIGQFARVITWREYRSQNELRLIDVKIPELRGTGNTELEKRVNGAVQDKIDALVAESEARAKETYQLFADEKREKEYRPMEIQVDYEIKCSSEETVSFVITKFESLASAYTEQYFYNLNLKTGEDLTLSGLLGPDYKEIADQSVRAQIAQRKAEDENNLYFDGTDGIEGFSGISEDQKFYVNSSGAVVVVFDKYEIAPGYMGIQEFEISAK